MRFNKGWGLGPRPLDSSSLYSAGVRKQFLRGKNYFSGNELLHAKQANQGKVEVFWSLREWEGCAQGPTHLNTQLFLSVVTCWCVFVASLTTVCKLSPLSFQHVFSTRLLGWGLGVVKVPKCGSGTAIGSYQLAVPQRMRALLRKLLASGSPGSARQAVETNDL